MNGMTTTATTHVFTTAVASQGGIQFDSAKFTGHDYEMWSPMLRPRTDSEDHLSVVLDEADAAITRKGYVRTGGWVFSFGSGGHSAFRAPVAVRTDEVAVGSVEWYDQFPGFWAACEAAEEWLKAHPGRLHNVSTIARGAKIRGEDHLAYTVLRYLDEHGMIAADGNGSWRKYAAKRN